MIPRLSVGASSPVRPPWTPGRGVGTHVHVQNAALARVSTRVPGLSQLARWVVVAENRFCDCLCGDSLLGECAKKVKISVVMAMTMLGGEGGDMLMPIKSRMSV